MSRKCFGDAATTLMAHALAALLLSPAHGSEPLAPVSNLVIGGAERRCSSFTGAAKGRDCVADWDTILAQDSAFLGVSKSDVRFDESDDAPAFTYSLTSQRVQAFLDTPRGLFEPSRKRAVLARLAETLAQRGEWRAIPWSGVEEALGLAAARVGVSAPLTLSLAEGAILRSALVDPLPPRRRKRELRSIAFSANQDSAAIAHAVVAAARAVHGGKTPLIGVVTASSGPHPFVDHDINMTALQSAGARVVYLPLDGGFRQAVDASDCGNMRYHYVAYANTNPQRAVYHADLLYPDLAQQQVEFCENHARALHATLEQVNGIYFAGGNQARHLESLVGKDSAGNYTVVSTALAIIQRRFALGELVVAGTSAGNHIQGGGMWRGKPVSMIGGGDSYDVLKSGFSTGQGPAAEAPALGQPASSMPYAPSMYPLGGLGVFRFGVLDSHFSKRAREARLVRAVHDSGMDYGFGVDENTALLVRRPDADGTSHFSVLGAGGVFIADVRPAHAQTSPERHFSIEGVRAHYLLPGDTAHIDAAGQLHVRLSEDAPALAVRPEQVPIVQNRLLDYGASNFMNLANAMGWSGAQQGSGSTIDSNDTRSRQTEPHYGASLRRIPQTVVRGTAPTRVSYTHLLLGFAPLPLGTRDAARDNGTNTRP